ncbi:MAG: PSD1 and planctomycete cytochrome C domain-containing protein [Verrucomicrobiales bacterium]|nr:PSD1 and planctomycete cytochrome C domain-containing protein [Verrucomicrobiales bacterium]
MTNLLFRILPGLLAVVPVLLVGAPDPKEPNPAGAAFFENRVRPILVEHCYECHSEKAGKQKGDLLLDRPSGWLEGGTSGPAVIPGNIEESLLSLAISHEDEDYAMPKEKLPEGKINVLNRWIQMGAPGPKKALKDTEFSRLGDQDYLLEKAKTHWSFQPVVKPELPESTQFGDHPIDRFVGQKLEEKGLKMNPEADRRTLLRRLSYDLTGLPPTPEEVSDFLENESNNAYEEQVDRLLASPHFGERWGRYWLDIARYADTREWQAAGRDSRYPFAYTYRDWVIAALNNDMPYDEFLRKQIAADFYTEQSDDPSLAALGFLTVGSRFRNNVDEIANDRIDAVTRGVMGLTVACARCHDHKYDPIPTSDYYALHGVFRSSEDIDTYPKIGTAQATDKEIADYEKKVTGAIKARDDYKRSLANEGTTEFRKRPVEYMGAIYEMSVTRKATVQKLISGNKFKETALTPIGKKIERIGIEKSFAKHPFWRPFHLLIKTKDGAFKKAFREYVSDPQESDKVNPVVTAALKREPAITNAKMLSERYGEIFREVLAKKASDLNADEKKVLQIYEAPGGIFAITPNQALAASQVSGKGRTAIAKLDNVIRDLDSEHPAAPPRAMIVKEAAAPVKPRIYNRGLRTDRGDSVPRRWLTIFGAAEFPDENSGRGGLAESVASSDNQFTTRAAVNRTWMHLFGQPLMITPGDMGLQSEPPSHPAMMDWLASQFVEEGWSIKSMIRRMVLSNTYRQSSATRKDGETTDIENTLLWRANIRRLDFESMRDSILAAAGTLDPAMGGRAIEITAPPYSPRRTVYALIDRVNLDNLFATFDFPSPAQSAPQRPQTMVPQQALYGMNDAFAIIHARHLTGAISETDDEKVRRGRINNLYQRVFQRDATAEELRLASGFLGQATDGTEIVDASGWKYGYGSSETDTPPEERFTEFPYYSKKREAYQFSVAYPHPKMRHLDLSANSGHPGYDSSMASIRRWIAPYSGKFKIRAELLHSRDAGDGIRGRLFSSRQGLLRNTHVFNETKNINFADLELEKGEILDFTVDCRTNPNSDAFRLTIEISRVGEAEYDEPGMMTAWDSQTDFSGPPPPPLTKWQQLAHALLQTNEFLFID